VEGAPVYELYERTPGDHLDHTLAVTDATSKPKGRVTLAK